MDLNQQRGSLGSHDNPSKIHFRLAVTPPVYSKFAAFKERFAKRVFRPYLVDVLCNAACSLRGDVLRDRHRLHGLERRWVRSGEAAAHALVNRTIPGENSVLSQRARLTAHWRKTMQDLPPKSKKVTDHWLLVIQCQSTCEVKGSTSYCSISQCWGKNLLRKGEKTAEEETVQRISLSPSWSQQLPKNTERKMKMINRKKICWLKARVGHRRKQSTTMLGEGTLFFVPPREGWPFIKEFSIAQGRFTPAASLSLWRLPGLSETYQPYQWSHWLTGHFATFSRNPLKAQNDNWMESQNIL